MVPKTECLNDIPPAKPTITGQLEYFFSFYRYLSLQRHNTMGIRVSRIRDATLLLPALPHYIPLSFKKRLNLSGKSILTALGSNNKRTK